MAGMFGRSRDTGDVTREEFRMLRDQMQSNSARLDEIDRTGTRGSTVVSAQLTEVIKDVAAVRTDLDGFRREHGEAHAAEARARTVARRWAIGTLIAALIAIETPLGWLILRIH